MQIIDLIMNTETLKENPPILLDVGASGSIHYKWKGIAKYSTCIAFDPDGRDIETIASNQLFRKTHFVNNLVSYEEKKKEDFYLTKSPYCSSMLKPLQTEVDKYSFGYLFEVKQVLKVNATTLEKVLKELNIAKVDWLKIDSQGIDLKIFQSLPKRHETITVEFEPGFMDAYQNEDKISDVLSFMEKQNFWMSEFLVEGDARISKSTKLKYFSDYKEKRLTSILKTNPFWAGITYMNNFSQLNKKRDYLLGIAFNYVDNNFGYCLELCEMAVNKYKDVIFKEIMGLLLRDKKALISARHISIKPIDFNNSLSQVFSVLSNLKVLDEKFILYGAGTGAELILGQMPNSIEYIVDKDQSKIGSKVNSKPIYSLEKIKNEQKRIIISVFGREQEIADSLINEHKVEPSQIITIL